WLDAWHVVGTSAVAAPVHRPVVRHATQALRDHRALHRMELGGDDRRPSDEVEEDLASGFWCREVEVRDHRSIGGAKVPGQAVDITEHMAASTGRVTMARGERRVIEEAAPVDDTYRLGVIHRDVAYLSAGHGVDDRNRIVKTRQHVEPVCTGVEREPGGP